jgi:hypothetical protein
MSIQWIRPLFLELAHFMHSRHSKSLSNSMHITWRLLLRAIWNKLPSQYYYKTYTAFALPVYRWTCSSINDTSSSSGPCVNFLGLDPFLSYARLEQD